MQVGPVLSVPLVPSAIRQPVSAEAAINQAQAAESVKKVFTPAPPIRPTVQDVIDFDRALIAIREG